MMDNFGRCGNNKKYNDLLSKCRALDKDQVNDFLDNCILTGLSWDSTYKRRIFREVYNGKSLKGVAHTFDTTAYVCHCIVQRYTNFLMLPDDDRDLLVFVSKPKVFNMLKSKGINSVRDLAEYYNNNGGFGDIPSIGKETSARIVEHLKLLGYQINDFISTSSRTRKLYVVYDKIFKSYIGYNNGLVPLDKARVFLGKQSASHYIMDNRELREVDIFLKK